MTDETARAGKRGPACSKPKVMELNHCPSSSDDGQERIPQPMNAVDSVPESVPARRQVTTGRNGFRNGIHCVHWLELGACFVHTRTTETKVKERLAQQKMINFDLNLFTQRAFSPKVENRCNWAILCRSTTRTVVDFCHWPAIQGCYLPQSNSSGHIWWMDGLRVEEHGQSAAKAERRTPIPW